MDEELHAQLLAIYLEEGADLLGQLAGLWDTIAAAEPEQADGHRKTAVRVAHNFAGIAGSTGFMSAMRLGLALDLLARARLSEEKLGLARGATALLLSSLGKHGQEGAQDDMERALRA